MARYLFCTQRQPRAWWDEGADLSSEEPRTITVLEGDDIVDTGLLDADGNAIRKRVKEQIGFIRSDS